MTSSNWISKYTMCVTGVNWKVKFFGPCSYTIASDSYWTVYTTPTLAGKVVNILYLNTLPFTIEISNFVAYGDEFQMFYGSPDWNLGNEFGNPKINYKQTQIGFWLAYSRYFKI